MDPYTLKTVVEASNETSYKILSVFILDLVFPPIERGDLTDDKVP